MKNKRVAITAGIAVLSAATIVICSCFSEHAPIAAAIHKTENVDQPTSSTVSDTSISETESVPKAPNAEAEESASMSESVAENTSAPESKPESSSAERPEKRPPEIVPTYDDPSTYLEYDPAWGTYNMTDEEKLLGENSLFVGDSITNGFIWCGALNPRNVYATPSVGARNMLTFDMTYRDKPAKFIPVLNKTKPKYVFLWMGMNDVNLTSAADYCKNYKKIIDTALANSTADVYVCAMSPISNPKYSELSKPGEFNTAIHKFILKNYTQRVYYIDFVEPIKNSSGVLANEFDSGDGVHPSNKAYYVALHEINKQVKENDRLKSVTE